MFEEKQKGGGLAKARTKAGSAAPAAPSYTNLYSRWRPRRSEAWAAEAYLGYVEQAQAEGQRRYALEDELVSGIVMS